MNPDKLVSSEASGSGTFFKLVKSFEYFVNSALIKSRAAYCEYINIF